MPPPPLPTDMEKRELRRILKQRRKEISVEQHREWDRAIVESIAASELFQNASMLLLYAPMEGEINLLPLARIARQMGKPIAFPRCDTQNNTMEFYVLTEDTRLRAGAYDIPEPPEDAPVCIPDERALCILPGLSFDLCGNRIGYGKGYYDRYVSTFLGVTLGAAYANLLLREVPTEPHDLPVQWLCTERGIYDTASKRTPIPAAKNDDAEKAAPPSPEKAKEEEPTPKQKQKQPILARIKTLLSGKGDLKPLHAPAALVLCTFALLLLSRLIDKRLLDRDSAYVGVILLQVLIFIIPAILYCKLRSERFAERIRMRLPHPEHGLFLLHMLVVMISVSLLSSILTGGIRSLDGSFTLYNTFVARTDSPAEIVYAVLAYALLPAFGEELVYRSILCAEYEKHGVGVAITVTSLFFAMLHFSFAHFLTYLLMGALLSCAMYTTRSFFTPVLLHLLYNVFCLFGQPYLSAFYVNAGSNELFIFCLLVIFLLFAAFAAGEARKIYHLHAKRGADSSYTIALPLRQWLIRIPPALATPVAAVCLVVWLTATVLTLN